MQGKAAWGVRMPCWARRTYSKNICTFSKKSSNYLLVQLPSPQCCIAIATECIHVIRLLLIISGDIETNPGPASLDTVLAELQKLTAGQTTLVQELKSLKLQLTTTDKTISDLNKRMTDLEAHYQALMPLRQDIKILQTTSTETTRLVTALEARFDDAENRSRRNNLIFHGITDPTTNETFTKSEELIIQICRDHLQTDINPTDIERAHRLGKHTKDRNRPIIVKFAHWKTKDALLSKGRMLKGTNYSVGEDFSRLTQKARKALLHFAKSKSLAYSLRYKTLYIGPKRYVFDESSNSVKEIL
ncbi:uncharacterized protein [Dermacentor albipictus]|uniref:uncharacterized protein n=1 Tax=Dermacentor albipictus TaxID=60249 RepID=UPI0038FC72F9